MIRRELMTDEELRSQLRPHGIEDLAEVERANIEPNGQISIVCRDYEETEPVEPPKTI